VDGAERVVVCLDNIIVAGRSSSGRNRFYIGLACCSGGEE